MDIRQYTCGDKKFKLYNIYQSTVVMLDIVVCTFRISQLKSAVQ